MNTALLLLINGLAGRSALLDAVMVFSARWLLFGVGLLLAACLVVLVRERSWRSSAWIAVTMVVGVVLLQLAGLWHPDHRPFMDHAVHQLVAHAPGASFPSDHTTAAATMALAVLAFSRFRRTGLIMLGLAVVIGFSRVFVGVHYPLDIAGGFAVALLSWALVAATRRWWLRRPAARTAGDDGAAGQVPDLAG